MSGVPREVRVRQITALRAEGLTYKEIGKRLGLTGATVNAYALDPDRSRVRKSKEKHFKQCACGNTIVTKGALICSKCRNLSLPQRRWTKERIIGALQRFYFEHGVAPTQAAVALKQNGHYPQTGPVAREFGSWENAVVAAGFKPWKYGDGSRKPF